MDHGCVKTKIYLERPRNGTLQKVSGTMNSRASLVYFPFHALEKEMATHCSVLAWRIPGTGEPGGPPSMGSHRVGQD